MNVLSLFDGMSCGQIALNRAGIAYDKYYASEIDKHAIKVTQHNYPDTKQLGDVTKITTHNAPKIDLLIGGSPCQSFSFAGTMVGMVAEGGVDITTLEQYLDLKSKGFQFEGYSYLFWEYVRILTQLKPQYFLLENVVMQKKWEKIITDTLGVDPIFINSNSFSAQGRKRLYWTNIPYSECSLSPNDCVISDILARDNIDVIKTNMMSKQKVQKFIASVYDGNNLNFVSDDTWTTRFFAKVVGTLAYKKANRQIKLISQKSNCLTTSGQKISNSGSTNVPYITNEGKFAIAPMNRLECERLQTVPEGYTSVVSDVQAKHMLGNGWTVDVIAHILKGIT